MATSSTGTPQPTCFAVSNCEALAKPFTQACSSGSDNGRCVGGYQAKCSSQFYGTILSQTPTTPTAGGDCISSCTNNAACVGFTFTGGFSPNYVCTLYRTIDTVGTGFGTTFRKVCDDGALAGSSSSVASPVSSTVLGTTSTASSETISPTPTIKDMLSSSTTMSISSASPSPSKCPYSFDGTDCPLTETKLADACAITKSRCTSRYNIGCGQSPVEKRTAFLIFDNPVDADECAPECDNDPACLGFVYSREGTNDGHFTCTYYSSIGGGLGLAGRQDTVSFFKYCGIASPEPPIVESSSSASPTISSVAASSTPSPVSPPNTTLYANACPSQNTRCLSNYRVACSTSIFQVGSTVIARLNVPSADACVAACNAEATCIAVQMATDDDGSGQCMLVSKYEQASLLSPRFTSFFRGCSDNAMSSGSMSVPTLASSTLNTIASPSSVTVSSTPGSATSSTPGPSTSSSAVPSSSSATPIPTPTPVPALGPFAATCPSQDAQCVANYRVACSTYLFAGGATDLGAIRVPTADACVAACTANSACVAVLFANETQPSCTLYSKTGGIGPAPGPTPEIFTAFFKGCMV
jgi:hypothetical protein